MDRRVHSCVGSPQVHEQVQPLEMFPVGTLLCLRFKRELIEGNVVELVWPPGFHEPLKRKEKFTLNPKHNREAPAAL